MDFLTYSRIRAYCWQDIGPHIDTPDRETLLRFRIKSEGGRRGDIRHEAIEAKWFIEATAYLKPRELAAAALLANVSNLYLETTVDLPRTENSPPPLGKVEADELARMTRDAVTDYGNFLPEREAAAMVAAYEKAAPEQNTATPAPVKDLGAPDGAISLEQVNQAFFGARFWISRARIRQAVTPVELLALVIEYHHHGDKNKFVTDWYQALRAAVSAGSIAARDVDSLIPLSSLPAGDEWLVTVHDAEQFIRSIGLGWSVTKAIEHVFAECFPPAPEPQATTPSPAPEVAEGASDSVELLAASVLKRNAATGPVFSTVRAALVSDHLHQWPTIDRDLKDAATNGLSAAKAGARDWNETAALAWAKANNKLKSAPKPADVLTQAMHSMGNLPGRKHTPQG